MSWGRVVVVGFVGSIAIMAALLWLVGLDNITAALATASLELFVVAALIGLAQMACWGLSLRAVLGSLDADVSRSTGVLLYGTAMFANNVTPFGQAGGEPVTAYLINRVTETKFESSLVAIATVDAAHIVSSVSLIIAGALVTLATVSRPGRATRIGLWWAGFVLGALVLATIAWRRRHGIAERFTAAIEGRGDWDHRLPDPIRRLTVALRSGARQVHADLERVAEDRRRLATTIGFSGAGWVCNVGVLAVTLMWLDSPLPIPTLLVLVPVAAIAGFAPLPGGFGSIEAALVGLLVTTTPIGAGVATAGVLIYRTSTYWLHLLVGGSIVAILSVTGRVAR